MGVIYQADKPNYLLTTKRLLKITLFTIVTAAIAGLGLIARADDTNAAPTSDQPAKQKFYGPVSAVDANAKTFTVGDQTFSVTDDSQLSRNGKDATLADVVVGDLARGSYTKGDDGKLDVTKVRFGKKAGGKHKKSETPESGSDTNAAAATPPNQ